MSAPDRPTPHANSQVLRFCPQETIATVAKITKHCDTNHLGSDPSKGRAIRVAT
jgi:hypothetical protein